MNVISKTRPWREIATEASREHETARLHALLYELLEALEQQLFFEDDSNSDNFGISAQHIQ
jgi:hypothetical protein